mmetsp:Transcript_3065/g.8712  ORF Transcript_3065/g.8712 Transcript_3065/m.8712 type:complete len:216 (-) Transcript_3065:720-1367(-)
MYLGTGREGYSRYLSYWHLKRSTKSPGATGSDRARISMRLIDTSLHYSLLVPCVGPCGGHWRPSAARRYSAFTCSATISGDETGPKWSHPSKLFSLHVDASAAASEPRPRRSTNKAAHRGRAACGEEEEEEAAASAAPPDGRRSSGAMAEADMTVHEAGQRSNVSHTSSAHLKVPRNKEASTSGEQHNCMPAPVAVVEVAVLALDEDEEKGRRPC